MALGYGDLEHFLVGGEQLVVFVLNRIERIVKACREYCKRDAKTRRKALTCEPNNIKSCTTDPMADVYS